jgi:hypothetical protein
MNDMDKIADTIKQPIKLEKIMSVADSRSKPHHLQALLAAIEEHNNMHTSQIDGLMFSVLHEPKKTAPHYIHRNIGSLEQFKGLRSPTRYFKFGAVYHQDFNTMFEQTAEVLRSGTNFNQFVFLDLLCFQSLTTLPLDALCTIIHMRLMHRSELTAGI